MDLAGDNLLAGAVFAEDQNVGIGRRGAVDQRPHALHSRRFSEQRRVGRWRQLRRPAALGARVDAAPAQRSRAAHRRREALVAPRLGDEVAGPRLQRLDRDRHRAVGGDDHHGGIGLLLHDSPKEIETLAPVGRAAFEIEVEQDRIRAFPLQERQELGGRAQRLHPFEHVAERKTRSKRDIRIVVDDDGKAERRFHATPVAYCPKMNSAGVAARFIPNGTQLAAIGA